MKKKCIVFDLDGTLLDTKYDLLYALNSCFLNHGVREISVEEMIKHLGRGLLVLFSETLVGDFSEQEKESMFKEFTSNYNDHCMVFTSIYSGVRETLKIIKEKGYKIAVVSNKANEYAVKIIDHYFPNVFDFVTGAIEGIPKKPNPDLVYLCLDKLCINKEDAFYVGDSIYDFYTALNSKLEPIMLSYGYGDEEEIKKNGAKIILDNFKSILEYL